MLSVKLWILLLILPLVAANLQINEVMYAPNEGSEWVEIYNPASQAINLSGWSLVDNKNTDSLGCCLFDQACSLLIPALSYALITGQDTTLYSSLTTNALKICVDDNSLGNGLSNSGDSIRIFNATYKNHLVYNSTYANKNGMSLEFDNGFWRESYVLGGTPGLSNSVTPPVIVNSPNASNSITSSEIQQQVPVTPNPPKSPSFEIIKLVEKVNSGENFDLVVDLDSGDSPHQFKVWAYVYSRNKCISCGSLTREANQQTILLDANEKSAVHFNLKIPDETLSGEYKLKVKIMKDDKTTPYELKEILQVINNRLASNESTKVTTQLLDHAIENDFTPNETIKESLSLTNKILPENKPIGDVKIAEAIVYQSKDKKVRKLIPYFVVFTIVILASIYITKSDV